MSILLAAAVTVNARQIQSGDFVGQTVSVRGSVVTAVRDEIDSRFNWIVLDSPEGRIYAATPEARHSLEELGKLTDAEIDLVGTVGQFTSWRRFLGFQLTFGDEPESGYTVISPAPDDPFAVPTLGNGKTAFHRRKTGGKVIAVSKGHFFFRSHDGLVIRATPEREGSLPPVRSTVTVTGFPGYGQFNPLLNNALWRLEEGPSGDFEKAESVDVDSLFVQDGERRYVNNHLCGRVIELVGRVESIPGQSDDQSDTIEINCAGTRVKVDLGGIGNAGGAVPSVGATIAVAGLCYGNFSATDGTAAFPRLESFTLFPRTPNDIRIIRGAPWMTPKMLLWVIGVLTAALALFAVWVTALRVVSSRRARELAREQILGARAELKVEERTRLAVELHDSISQTLTGVALQIDAASGADGDGSKIFLNNARNMLASCRQELNGCLWDLRSRTFEEKDMTEAVQRTLAPHVGSARLTVRFNVPRERLSEQTAHAVLRIIRELGTNAVKHGHANNVKIAGEFHDDTISFSVTDDGRGFDTATAPGPAQGHFGLQGVRERLNAFNGTIRCDSEPGCGAKFTVTLHTTEPEDE